MKLRINNMSKHFKTMFLFLAMQWPKKSGKCNAIVFWKHFWHLQLSCVKLKTNNILGILGQS